MYTGVCRRIFEAEGGVERELAKRENEMGSPVDKTVWARDDMSFRENIKTLCIGVLYLPVPWHHFRANDHLLLHGGSLLPCQLRRDETPRFVAAISLVRVLFR